MKLKDISYELLLLIRGGYISDDERIDTRLIDKLVDQYRIEYVGNLQRVNKSIPESYNQTTNIVLTLTDRGTYKSLESSDSVPKIPFGKFGPMIAGLYSPYVDEYSYTMVGRNQLRFSGNGKFNQRIIYFSYFDGRLVLKSKESAYRIVSDVDLTAVFSNPQDVPEFDVELDDYPIDEDGVNWIKEQFLKLDAKILMGQFSDEVNDASGEVLNG